MLPLTALPDTPEINKKTCLKVIHWIAIDLVGKRHPTLEQTGPDISIQIPWRVP